MEKKLSSNNNTFKKTLQITQESKNQNKNKSSFTEQDSLVLLQKSLLFFFPFHIFFAILRVFALVMLFFLWFIVGTTRAHCWNCCKKWRVMIVGRLIGTSWWRILRPVFWVRKSIKCCGVIWPMVIPWLMLILKMMIYLWLVFFCFSIF
jgi:hypothetical protein